MIVITYVLHYVNFILTATLAGCSTCMYNCILTKNTLAVKESCGQDMKKAVMKRQQKRAAKACEGMLLITL